jgi:hypothetical protein
MVRKGGSGAPDCAPAREPPPRRLRAAIRVNFRASAIRQIGSDWGTDNCQELIEGDVLLRLHRDGVPVQ